MADFQKIKVTKNGPYHVSGSVPLAEQIILVDADRESHDWREGQKYPRRENYRLCRCGHSVDKPFCDDTHLDIDFDGTETAGHKSYLEQAREITGPDLILTDNRRLCASARFCDRAGGIWKLTRESDEPRARQTAIEEAGDCPSGRLVVWEQNKGAVEPDFEPSIGLVLDAQKNAMGPLWIRSSIPVESAHGVFYEIRNRVTLCRCGKSLNKPFCDGRHLGK